MLCVWMVLHMAMPGCIVNYQIVYVLRLVLNHHSNVVCMDGSSYGYARMHSKLPNCLCVETGIY